MRYQTGDIARVKKDLEIGKIYGGMRFIGEMQQYLGKKVIAKKAAMGCGFDSLYTVDVDGNENLWTDEMLEDVEEKRFSVGDLVKIVKIVGTKGKEEFLNNIYEISKDRGYGDEHYPYCLDGVKGYYFNHEELELVKAAETSSKDEDIKKYKELVNFLLEELENARVISYTPKHYLEKLRPDLAKLLK